MSIQPACKSCRFWHSLAPRKAGECRLLGPQRDLDNPWPITKPTEWCGEHKERTYGAGKIPLGAGFVNYGGILDDIAAAFGFVRKEPPRKSDRPCSDCSGAGQFADGAFCDSCGGTGYAVVF